MKFHHIVAGNGKQKNKRNKHSARTCENRTKFEVQEEEEESCTADTDSHGQQFRKIAAGRAYQIMMVMAAIQYRPLEQLNIISDKLMDTESDEENENYDDQIISGDVLNTYARIGRFFDTISKEATMIRDNDENVLFGEIAKTSRTEREAAEANRRHIEMRARCEQDELLKQVMKIHQNVSELVYDQLTDDVIDEYANKVAKNMMKYVIVCDQDKAGRDENIEQKVQDFLVHFANTRCEHMPLPRFSPNI